MNGTIDVTSIPGEGTSFNIFIPNNQSEFHANSSN